MARGRAVRPAALAAVGVLLGLAGLVLWREAKGATAPAPGFVGELVRLEDIFAGALGPRVSPAGLAELKRLEGFRAEPYPDQAGHLTIGYGHKVLPGESFTRITSAEGEQLLAADVAAAEAMLARYVTVPLTQGQRDALTSFLFNVDSDDNGAFRESTLLRLLNAGDYEGARAELARWVFVKGPLGEKTVSAGLKTRRAAEAALFVA
jgi:lysozyme